MSLFTGQFDYEIEDLGIKKASFYLGKTDGIIYISDFDPIHPSEKEDLYWIPDQYCFKIVNNPDHTNITTIPIYPIPNNLNDVKPSYNDNSGEINQQVWLFVNKFTINNTIEYIKFYITEEENQDDDLSSNYKFYNIDSNNNLIEIDYDIPKIKKNNIEVSIKKNDQSIIFNGTWSNITETYDIVKFHHNSGYDYKYSFRLDLYESIYNNINNVINLIHSTKTELSNIASLINDIYSNIDNNDKDQVYSLKTTTLNTIEPFINEIKEKITTNELLYIGTYNPDNPELLTYIIAPAFCANIINTPNLFFNLDYILFNMLLVTENLKKKTSFQDNYTFYATKVDYEDSDDTDLTSDPHDDMSEPIPDSDTNPQILLNITFDHYYDPGHQLYDFKYKFIIKSNVPDVNIYYTIGDSDEISITMINFEYILLIDFYQFLAVNNSYLDSDLSYIEENPSLATIQPGSKIDLAISLDSNSETVNEYFINIQSNKSDVTVYYTTDGTPATIASGNSFIINYGEPESYIEVIEHTKAITTFQDNYKFYATKVDYIPSDIIDLTSIPNPDMTDPNIGGKILMNIEFESFYSGGHSLYDFKYKFTITFNTANVILYYTIDGTDPDPSINNYYTYPDPIYVIGSEELIAVDLYSFLAVNNNYTMSNITPIEINPTLNPLSNPIELAVSLDENNETDNEYFINIQSNKSDVTVYYTTDGSTPTTNSNNSFIINYNELASYIEVIPQPKYIMTYLELSNYIESDMALTERKYNVLEYSPEQDINTRKYYIDLLNHFDIFSSINYKSTTGKWYPSCNTNCSNSSINISLKKLKYNSNISNIEYMIKNITEIYHIGELQELLINKLIEILTFYKTKTLLIDINPHNTLSHMDDDHDNLIDINHDDSYDTTLYAFIDICNNIIDYINNISKYIIYNNNYIFSSSENDQIKLSFNFNNISNYNSSNSNIVFSLPFLDASSIQLDDLLITDPDITDNIFPSLYDDVTNNITQIINIYDNAIQLCESKKSTFNSLKTIINLRLQSIIDYILYTKNLLDD